MVKGLEKFVEHFEGLEDAEQLKYDLNEFLGKHPPESEDWQGIRQSVGEGALDTPRIILHQLRVIFGIGIY